MPASKRRRSLEADEARPRRRPPPRRDILSSLSDELLLRIFSYLDEHALLGLAPVSSLFRRISADSQLWRPHYYRRFVLPRTRAMPRFPPTGPASDPARAAARRRPSRSCRCAPDAASSGDLVDWKKRYRLRHNWARGACAVGELPVHGIRPPPQAAGRPTLAKVVDGLALTADLEAGLRAWDLRSRQLIAQADLGPAGGGGGGGSPLARPTCLAVPRLRPSGPLLDFVTGFEDGRFAIWRLDSNQRKLALIHGPPASPGADPLVAVAYGHPYILTATSRGSISLYTLAHPGAATTVLSRSGLSPEASDEADEGAKEDWFPTEPYRLTTLQSHSTRLPLALSIRRMAKTVVASVAYTFDAVGGWAVGIQDLDIVERPTSGLSSPKADVISSKVACTLPTPSPTRTWSRSWPAASSPTQGRRQPQPGEALEESDEGPIRLCYSHPYLLVTLPDNTLVLHLCTSTATSLSISDGLRLWGHTSGISDAEITPRGKAVSVSTWGDEIRLWELEGRLSGASVEVRPRRQDSDVTDEGPPSTPAAHDGEHVDHRGDRKRWVGFDEEMVVVLKGGHDGRESLVVYDFT